jgi:arylsulfatase A-like enzyme
LIILVDDAGYADFGFQGGGIADDFAALTPNIDSIAGNGLRFSNGYVCGAVSCPSRAALLTGRYQQRYGMEQNISSEPEAGLPTSEKTIADTLKASGYRTYALGKWHLGQDLPEHHPNQRGFDEFFGFLSGARTYFQFTGPGTASRLQQNGVFITETADQPYLTDRLGAEAAAYLDTHALNHPTTPFFMYLAFNAVHTPLEADLVRLADPRIQGITVPERKTLAAMTIALDDAVGVVLAKLEQHGLAENTLLVFLSDNGGPEDNLDLLAPNWSSNGPLRLGKTTLYEGGIRIPFAVRWPAGIPPAITGTTLPDPVTTLDILPTLVAAASGSLLPGQLTDGHSLLPRLNGTSPTPLQRRHFWRTGGSTGGQSAVRQGNWKLVRNNETGVTELYDLAGDIGETADRATEFPAAVAELLAAHARWEEGMVEPLWGGNAPVVSNTNLVRRSCTLGYELEKTGAGFSYMAHELREPLLLGEDWELDWRLESVPGTGYSRNGAVVLGDRLQADRFIRFSMDFSTGRVGIYELSNGAGTTGQWPAVSAGTETDFRLQYDAATRTITCRSGSSAISHALTAFYEADRLSFAGYGLQSRVQTRFSPINRHVTPSAAGVSPTWAILKFTRDYSPGAYDANGRFLGGTELLSLVSHQGRLYAGVGYWNDVVFGAGSSDPHPGPQVLVKESWNAPWEEDVAFGPNHLRVECLKSLTLTTDKHGAPLDPPVTLLLAGSGELTGSPRRRAVVFIRGDSGTWTPTYPGSVASGTPSTRVLFDHVDTSLPTPVHWVFCGFGGADASVVRGGYNAATGLIDWESATPELTGTERILSAGECNGFLYACIGSDGEPDNGIGGVFWREDGPGPYWHFVCEWPLNGEMAPDIRGFTAVPHPDGFDYEVALVTLESYGVVFRIDPIGGDPRNGHIVNGELDIQAFLGDVWQDGAPVGFPTLSAYNDMPEVQHPGTGQPVNLIGLGVGYPAADNTPERNSAYYLVRHRDATYEWGRVFDPAFPLPNPTAGGLRATRALRVSPFPEDRGLVLFTGGFDAASQSGPIWHNTAWIYRGRLTFCPDGIEGDLDGDGRMTAIDLLILRLTLAGAIQPGATPCNYPECADLSGDGVLDAADAALLAARLAESLGPVLF